jgi:hypothetical protein
LKELANYLFAVTVLAVDGIVQLLHVLIGNFSCEIAERLPDFRVLLQRL